MKDPATDQATLIASLCDPARNGALGGKLRLLQTHISYVLLTGEHAYKVKKAVRLPFLDFTTLASRKFYCEEELRLNRRLAPELYLDVVAITGTVDAPAMGGSGPVLDYALRMREFPQQALLGNVLHRNALTPAHIDELAGLVARFHARAAIAPTDGRFGVPDDVLRTALVNFVEIRELLDAKEDHAAIDALEAWTRSEHASRRASFAARRRAGCVRECHGDLHLGNIALIDGRITVFDCIEFNERMRWIDVMSEVAFTAMDLDHGGRSDLARRFLNAYLEVSGDYDGLAVLRYYRTYRAMVRAKVARLRGRQLPDGAEREGVLREFGEYLRLARLQTDPVRPAIVITHGFAACGKSTFSAALLERIDAIRIRTDVERKRLHGIAALQRSRSRVGSDLYAPAATRATYDRVASLARSVVDGGQVAIVDGAFLLRWQRDRFRALSAELGVPFRIVDIRAEVAELRERVRRRAAEGKDASEADSEVLDHQLRTHEAIAPEECGEVLRCDGASSPESARAASAMRELVLALGGT